MDGKEAMNELNKTLGFNMKEAVLIGVEPNGHDWHEIVYGQQDKIADLILNFLDDNPEIKNMVFSILLKQGIEGLTNIMEG